MKTLPALTATALTAFVFAPFSAEIAVALLSITAVLAIFFSDYFRRPAKPLTEAALAKAQRLPLAA
jgi:hypothetical protein